MLIYTYSDLVRSLFSILDESSVSASPAVIPEHELISLDRLVRLPGTRSITFTPAPQASLLPYLIPSACPFFPPRLLLSLLSPHKLNKAQLDQVQLNKYANTDALKPSFSG